MQTLKNHIVSLLRFSERYTQVDMVYIARGGFWRAFSQISTSLISLGLVVAFANLLPKETYGLYQYVLSLTAILNVFSLTGMNSAVAQSVANGHEGALRASVRYQLKWNLLMTGALWALGGYYYIQGNETLALCFGMLGVFIPSTLALNTYGAYLDGKRQFAFASIATTVSSIVYAAGLLVAMVLSKELVPLVAAYAITTFISTLFFYWIVARRVRAIPDTASSDVLSYGRTLTFIGFIEPISGQIDKIILSHFWGPAQLAVYSLALAIPNRAMSFMKNWVGIAFPKFASKTVHELDGVFAKRLAQGIALGAVIAVAYVTIAPQVFTYLLPKYLESVAYSQILAISLVFAIPNRYVSLLLVSQQYSRLILMNSLVQTALRIALFVTLGVWGGIYGLVLAHVIMAALGMGINILVWKRGVATALE